MFISHSMDRGFAEYLEQTQQERIELISSDLVSAYAAEGNWDWMKSRRNWGRIVHSQAPPDRFEIPPGANMNRPQDYMLRDTRGQRLNGPPRPIPGMRFKDLMLDGEKIGELGYLPVSEFLRRGKDQYLERQSRNLATIILSSTFASLLAAAGIAWWLGHRVRNGTSRIPGQTRRRRWEISRSSIAGETNRKGHTIGSATTAET